MDELPSGTVTFLFTDVEGSTRLMEQLRDRWPEVHSTHRLLLREASARSGRREIDTQGDAFFVAFARARDGVNAAAAAQEALRRQEWPDEVEVRVRMGLHTGEPAVGDEGTSAWTWRAPHVCAPQRTAARCSCRRRRRFCCAATSRRASSCATSGSTG